MRKAGARRMRRRRRVRGRRREEEEGRKEGGRSRKKKQNHHLRGEEKLYNSIGFNSVFIGFTAKDTTWVRKTRVFSCF